MDDFEKTKRLLQKNLAISEESLRILKKIRKTQKVGSLIKFLKWVIIILLALGAYYYVQPFFETFWETASKIKEDISSIGQASNEIRELPPTMFENIQSFFEGSSQ